MTRSNRDLLDIAATHVRHTRALSRFDADIHRPEFWRALCPGLAITPRPVPPDLPQYPRPAGMETCLRQVREEGYFQMPPVVDADTVARIRSAIDAIVGTGLPPIFVFVYDEIYQLLARLGGPLEPLLGPRPRLLAFEFWAFHIEPADPVLTRWSAFEPHCDWLGGDPGVLSHGQPTALNVWIPLTDVSTLDSCMYVVPAHCDDHYFSPARRTQADLAAIRLQDIRALPAEAGSVLGWTTHLVHWGSRSSAFASGPRISLAAYLQRRDVKTFIEPSIDIDGEVPFTDRVRWISRALAGAGPGGVAVAGGG